MEHVTIYTDGACSGNPGPGGWCAIIRARDAERVLKGFDPATTNNRMELRAVIRGLSVLRRPCEVEVFTDSRYIVDAVNLGWLDAWVENDWRRKNGDDVLNQDLWKKLTRLLEKHEVRFFWVKGHAGDEANERCDAIATEMIKKGIL